MWEIGSKRQMQSDDLGNTRRPLRLPSGRVLDVIMHQEAVQPAPHVGVTSGQCPPGDQLVHPIRRLREVTGGGRRLAQGVQQWQEAAAGIADGSRVVTS